MTKPIIPSVLWLRVAWASAVIFASACASLAVSFDVPARPLGDMAPAAVRATAFFMSNFTVLAVLMAIALSLRHWVWAQYTLLVLLGLIYIGLFEQNISGIVWSGVDIGPQTLVAFGYVMLSVNYFVAAQTIPAVHRWAWLKLPFRLAAVGIWGLWALGRMGGDDLGYLLFSVAGCTVAVAHFFPVSTFTTLRGGYDVIIRNLIWVLLTGVLIGATIVIAGVVEGQSLTVVINRILIFAVTLGFGALFIRNIFVLQTDREMAVEEALARAIEQARISEELLEAQKNHRAAMDVARARNLRLATASHDIRQPLSSLRTSFAALARDMPHETQHHLQHSLDYLDELASSYVAEAAEVEDGPALAVQERVEDPDREEVRAEQIGQTLARMFEDDATAKGLSLRCDVASAALDTQPLALMRVLCNAVSNAIAHGAPGELRVEGAVTGQGYTFRVRNPGTADLTFEPWSKGEASDGSGLGLAIVREQAERAGLLVSTEDSTTQTIVCITVPAAQEAAQ